MSIIDVRNLTFGYDGTAENVFENTSFRLDTDWKLGFSTAIELYGEYRSAVGYVCKYISKAQEKIGGRWYYSGGQLDKPSVSLTDIDFDAFLSDNNDEAQLFKSGGLEFGIMTLGG